MELLTLLFKLRTGEATAIYEEPESTPDFRLPQSDPTYEALGELEPRPRAHRKLERVCKKVELDKKADDKEMPTYSIQKPAELGSASEEVYV